LVTRVPAQIARPLVDSLVNRVVVTDHRAEQLFPFERLPLADAIRVAISNTASGKVPTKFDDASSPVWQSSSTDPDWAGGTVLSDVLTATAAAGPRSVWRTVCRVGGERGRHRGEVVARTRGSSRPLRPEVARSSRDTGKLAHLCRRFCPSGGGNEKGRWS
jgi:hypothetical protein